MTRKLIIGKLYTVRPDIATIGTVRYAGDTTRQVFFKNGEGGVETLRLNITKSMDKLAGQKIKFSYIEPSGSGYDPDSDCFWIPEFLIDPISLNLDLI